MPKVDKSRIENDSMGAVRVPADALYGASTQRAVENFPISGERFSRPFIRALALIKRQAALVNGELGGLDKERARVIAAAAKEVEDGLHDGQFVVDIYQTGSGTSTNMNANEVIAARAAAATSGKTIHPNDHVNLGQSSNDVIPSALHIAAAVEWRRSLRPALLELQAEISRKAREFAGSVKTGRTHLQDATPITVGQEFSGYAAQINNCIERTDRSLPAILELPLGGTAVGTGINTDPRFAGLVIGRIAGETGLDFFEARNHFEAQSAKDAILAFSAELRGIACALAKIANDLRLLGSGPRCGIGELLLPAVQPGSSIMPGKVNPVIAESLLMVSVSAAASDYAVAAACREGSSFELNVMMPLIVRNILDPIRLLSNSASNFSRRCVADLRLNRQRLEELAELSSANATALVPAIGYDLAAEIAKESHRTGQTVRQIALQRKVLPEAELDQILDLRKMTAPEARGPAAGRSGPKAAARSTAKRGRAAGKGPSGNRPGMKVPARKRAGQKGAAQPAKPVRTKRGSAAGASRTKNFPEKIKKSSKGKAAAKGKARRKAKTPRSRSR